MKKLLLSLTMMAITASFAIHGAAPAGGYSIQELDSYLRDTPALADFKPYIDSWRKKYDTGKQSNTSLKDAFDDLNADLQKQLKDRLETIADNLISSSPDGIKYSKLKNVLFQAAAGGAAAPVAAAAAAAARPTVAAAPIPAAAPGRAAPAPKMPSAAATLAAAAGLAARPAAASASVPAAAAGEATASESKEKSEDPMAELTRQFNAIKTLYANRQYQPAAQHIMRDYFHNNEALPADLYKAFEEFYDRTNPNSSDFRAAYDNNTELQKQIEPLLRFLLQIASGKNGATKDPYLAWVAAELLQAIGTPQVQLTREGYDIAKLSNEAEAQKKFLEEQRRSRAAGAAAGAASGEEEASIWNLWGYSPLNWWK